MRPQHRQAVVPIFSGVLLLLVILAALQPSNQPVPIAERLAPPITSLNVPAQTPASPTTMPPPKLASPSPTTMPPPKLTGRIVASCCEINSIVVIDAAKRERNEVIAITMD